MSERVVNLPVAEAYDRWSAGYDAYDNPMVFAASRAVDALAPEAEGLAVLEFGCGTGRNLTALKVGGALRLVGLDLSDGMLAQARARDGAFDLRRQDMAQPVSEPDGAFGLILFSLTLEHVADIVTPLAEARRLLAPGGRIAIVEIHPFRSLGGLGAHFVEGDETVLMPTVSHSFEGYLNAFAAVGLAVAACRERKPRDLGADAPTKLFKHGADMPITVEFRLRANGESA